MRRLVTAAAVALLSASCTAETVSDADWDADGDGVVDPEEYADYREAVEEAEDAEWWEVAVAVAFGGYDDAGEDEVPEYHEPRKGARSDLVRPAAGPDGDCRGRAGAGFRGRDEWIRVEVVGVAPGEALSCVVEDAAGAFAPLGIGLAGPTGRATFEARTKGRWTLPGGAASAREMAGRRVEVRDGGDAVLLRGRVPSWRGGPPRSGTARWGDEGSGAAARVVLGGGSARGGSSLAVAARGLPPLAAVELLLEDGSVGAAGAADGAGRWSLRRDSRRGEPLPGDADGAASLAGRPFALRADGAVVLEGAFPVPGKE
jgi:hypothetical protein